MLGPLIIDLSGPELTAEDKELLQHPQVGGVIFFEQHYQSFEQMKYLMSEVKAICDPSLLICVDHEGGRIQRFKADFTELPSINTLGKLFDTEPERALQLSKTMGWLMAIELLSIGTDISFAPVLDLDRKINPCLQHRCFHHHAEVVSKLARAFRLGMNKAGMHAVAKHFPGHGGVAQDTHLNLAFDDRDYDAVFDNDLVPFKTLIDEKITALMVGHVCYPKIDNKPASYSEIWLKDILRQRLNYKGTIFSDDLSMLGACTEEGLKLSIKDRVMCALNAGCEMVLICNNRTDVITAVDHLVQENYYDPNLKSKLKELYGKSHMAFDSERFKADKKEAQTQLTILRKDR